MNTILFIVLIVLAVTVIVEIMKIYQVRNELKGQKPVTAITKGDNSFNGIMMLVGLFATIGYFIFVFLKYKQFLLPEAASEHGASTDKLLMITFGLIIFMFFVTQILLFYFGWRYKHDEKRRGFFFPDHHKLELIWTVIPAIVLVCLVTFGLVLWNKITAPAPKDAMVIELYGKQFDWTVRYAGKDNNLGSSNFRLISGDNIMGMDVNDKNGNDDIITHQLHLPVNRDVLLVIHSRDVIHSVYLPHFRVQMNAVPGLTTRFHFKPTISTAEMREKTHNDKFDYVLLCNKICGVAHYMMKLDVVCESQFDFDTWLKSQKTVAETRAAAPPTVAAK